MSVELDTYCILYSSAFRMLTPIHHAMKIFMQQNFLEAPKHKMI